MSNKEVEQILDKLLGRVTKLDEKIEDLKQVVIWREQGVLRSGQEMREKIDSMDAHRAQEHIHTA
jgi:hypothetical protein